MASVADSIGIRSHGIAGETLATLDLARARIFFLVRLGFPPFVDEADKFAFCAGASVVTVRIASALTARVEHTSARSASGVASVSFRDRDGVRWELCVG
jgi:hypothetical protein